MEREVVLEFRYPYGADWPSEDMSDDALIQDAVDTLFNFLMDGGTVEHNATVIHHDEEE